MTFSRNTGSVEVSGSIPLGLTIYRTFFHSRSLTLRDGLDQVKPLCKALKSMLGGMLMR